jgi:ribosomal protein L32
LTEITSGFLPKQKYQTSLWRRGKHKSHWNLLLFVKVPLLNKSISKMATLIAIDQENIAAPIGGGGKALIQPSKKMMAKTPSQPSRTLQPTRGFGVDLTKATNNTANHSGGGVGKGGVKGAMKQGGTKATQQSKQQPEIVLIHEIEKAHNPKAATSKQRAERRKKKIETIATDLKKPRTTVQGFLTSPFMITEEVSVTDLGEALRGTFLPSFLPFF